MALTPGDLALEIKTTEQRATRLLGVATAIVEEYAPLAPQELKDEAVIRFAAYLKQSTGNPGVVKSRKVDVLQADYTTNHAAMFRNCGAQALLTRWKVRRGGAIG